MPDALLCCCCDDPATTTIPGQWPTDVPEPACEKHADEWGTR